MTNSKGKRTSPKGLYWCNYWLKKANKVKLVIAELLHEKDSIKTFRLISNSSSIKDEVEWKPIKDKQGWYSLDVKENEINEFFDWL